MKNPLGLAIISLVILLLATTGLLIYVSFFRPARSTPSQTATPTSPAATLPGQQAGSTPEDPTGVIARKSFLVNYTPENYRLFTRFAGPSDRLLFFRAQVLNNKNGTVWPDPARRLSTGEVLTAWPSWDIAKQYTSLWAPDTDVFAYDIENDSGPEAQNLPATISLIRSELNKLSNQYDHQIKLSCGLNRNYGSRHISELSVCDDVHIHSNEFLKTYPQTDPKTGQNYVQWAVSQAKVIRQINPNIKIWFAALLSGVSSENALRVAKEINSEMKKTNQDFTGFTIWSDASSAQSFISNLSSL